MSGIRFIAGKSNRTAFLRLMEDSLEQEVDCEK